MPAPTRERIIQYLARRNPFEGVDGARLALDELLKGDATSMIERFGFRRKLVSAIVAELYYEVR